MIKNSNINLNKVISYNITTTNNVSIDSNRDYTSNNETLAKIFIANNSNDTINYLNNNEALINL